MYNSDINFYNKAKKINLNDYFNINTNFVKNSEFDHIPINFSWNKITKEDSNEIIEIKKKITNPPNQYKCGSCWAVTTCTSISDSFLISKIINWNPKISYTYALINYPQFQCLGGSPLSLLMSIEDNGIPSQNCLNYSWCEKNSKCSTDKSISHFGLNLSHLLPDEKDKCFFKSNKLFFFVKNIRLAILTESSTELGIYQFRKIIKQHILSYGPCIGGFIVFKNFSDGNFSFTKNIYIENADYLNKKFSFIQTDSDNIKGAHAVSIIGWGEEDNVVIDNNGTTKKIPYWVCRNSWGKKWGNNGGFFKIAMYPYNKKSQFEKNIFITDRDGAEYNLGGILLYEPNGLPVKRMMDGLKNKALLNNIDNNEKYFLSQDEDKIVNNQNRENIDFKIYNRKPQNLWLFLLVFILISILLTKLN